MKQTPFLRSHNIHLALLGKVCGGCLLLAGAAKEGRNIAMGSKEGGTGSSGSWEGLGFGAGKSFPTAKRVKMRKSLPGGMQNPITSISGDKI